VIMVAELGSTADEAMFAFQRFEAGNGT
jgi:hypothetical protein